MQRMQIKTSLAGAITGIVNGLFGAGGGMILIPLLRGMTDLKDEEIFPASTSIILPMCIVSILAGSIDQPLPWSSALPYLIGSAAGGVLAGIWGRKIPTSWLHKILGILILYGGWRYLC